MYLDAKRNHRVIVVRVQRERPGDQQHVRVPGARDEFDAEALDVVVRIAECVQFELAAVARAGVDRADAQRAAEDVENLLPDGLRVPLPCGFARRRGLVGPAGACDLFDELPHYRSCPA